jgi:hypothetical protein
MIRQSSAVGAYFLLLNVPVDMYNFMESTCCRVKEYAADEVAEWGHAEHSFGHAGLVIWVFDVEEISIF